MQQENANKIKELEKISKEKAKKIDTMAIQVEAMYNVFTSTNFVVRFVVKLFGAIGIITGAIIGIIELCKRTGE